MGAPPLPPPPQPANKVAESNARLSSNALPNRIGNRLLQVGLTAPQHCAMRKSVRNWHIGRRSFLLWKQCHDDCFPRRLRRQYYHYLRLQETLGSDDQRV